MDFVPEFAFIHKSASILVGFSNAQSDPAKDFALLDLSQIVAEGIAMTPPQ